MSAPQKEINHDKFDINNNSLNTVQKRKNNDMNSPRIFISSTCKDLSVHRQKIVEKLSLIGLQPIYSEDYAFSVDPTLNPAENCYETVEASTDILVLIIGNRYGSMDRNGKSITENEYRKAKEFGIPILVFIDQKTLDYLPLFDKNPQMDFNGSIDNPKLFDFVKILINEDKKWVFKYNSLSEIETALVSQLASLFSITLKQYHKINKLSNPDILNLMKPLSRRVFLQKGELWEYELITSLLYEFYSELKFKEIACIYAYSETPLRKFENIEDLVNISQLFDSDKLLLLMKNLGILINQVISKALGDPGVPGDVEMLIFVSKEISNCYKSILNEYIEVSKYCDNKLVGTLAKAYLSFINPLRLLLQRFPQDWENKVNDLRKAIANKETSIKFQIEIKGGDIKPFNDEFDALKEKYSLLKRN